MAEWGFKKFGEAAEKWPKTEDGKAIEPAFLEHLSGSQLDVELQVNMLKAYDIPVMLTYPNDGEFGKLVLGLSGTGVDVYVPETMLEMAQELLAAEVEDEEAEE